MSQRDLFLLDRVLDAFCRFGRGAYLGKWSVKRCREGLSNAYNGFTVYYDGKQVVRCRRGILVVPSDVSHGVDTNKVQSHIMMVWDRMGDALKGTGGAGRPVVLGISDTEIVL